MGPALQLCNSESEVPTRSRRLSSVLSVGGVSVCAGFRKRSSSTCPTGLAGPRRGHSAGDWVLHGVSGAAGAARPTQATRWPGACSCRTVGRYVCLGERRKWEGPLLFPKGDSSWTEGCCPSLPRLPGPVGSKIPDFRGGFGLGQGSPGLEGGADLTFLLWVPTGTQGGEPGPRGR